MSNKTTDATLERILELKGNMSQEAFGKNINMSQSNVSKMLKGTPPSAATLITIAKKYKVTVDWLLGLSEEKKNVHKLDVDSLTYADVLALIDRLYQLGTIREGYETNGFEGGPTPGIIWVEDRVLLFLLQGMSQLSDDNQDIAEIWKRRTIDSFASVPLLEWSETTNELFKQNYPKSVSNDAIKKLIDDVQNDRLELQPEPDSGMMLPFN